MKNVMMEMKIDLTVVISASMNAKKSAPIVLTEFVKNVK